MIVSVADTLNIALMKESKISLWQTGRLFTLNDYVQKHMRYQSHWTMSVLSRMVARIGFTRVC